MKKFITVFLIFLSFYSHAQVKTYSIQNKEAQFDPDLFLCNTDTSTKCSTLGNYLCDKGCYTIQSRFNYNFAKNCYFKDKRTGKAITPKYITVFDRRDESITYLKLKNERGFEYIKVKKHIQPKANSEMYFMIIANDTGYYAKTESEEYFQEYEESFAKSIENARNTTDTTAKNNPPSTTAASGNPDNVQEFKKNTDSSVFKFQSLDEALVILNNRYPPKSVIAENYYSDLNCLRIKISDNLSITYHINDTINLTNLIREAQNFYDSVMAKYADIIKSGKINLASIKSKYFTFISRQLDAYHLIASQIQIPDKDALKLIIEQNKNGATAEILKRDYRISGGFKIDFSAGVFLTGLSVPEFVAEDHSFQYKQANFTINTTTGAIDTVYTGQIIDTTGKLIHVKNPKMNYAAGFLCHAYFRTGTFINSGIATGLLVNNEGFQMLLGGSLMFSIRKSRISLSGGLSVGNQKTLSPTIERSTWQESYKDGSLYRTAGELPKFTAVTDIPTYNKWRTSWFFGLTYNFSSVSIRW